MHGRCCGNRWHCTLSSRVFDSQQHVELVAVVHVGSRSRRLQLGVSSVGAAAVVALGTDVVVRGERCRCRARSNCRGIGIERLLAQLDVVSFIGQIAGLAVRVMARYAVSDMGHFGKSILAEFTYRFISHRANVDTFALFDAHKAAVAGDASTGSTILTGVKNPFFNWVDDQ